MQNSLVMIILWLVCGAATIVAAVLAKRSKPARYLGRAAVGVLFIAGGALLHVAFYLALWPFGWIETVWVLIMLPAMILLLRAERRAAPAAPGGTPAAALQHA